MCANFYYRMNVYRKRTFWYPHPTMKTFLSSSINFSLRASHKSHSGRMRLIEAYFLAIKTSVCNIVCVGEVFSGIKKSFVLCRAYIIEQMASFISNIKINRKTTHSVWEHDTMNIHYDYFNYFTSNACKC